MAGPSLGVRKGAWTEEEDNLLRKCIERYGEKNWYKVPSRAGLNRCRKSCRLRWLNYLKPGIKKGGFEADEVDLILRLHKLLGNRWSLIAGRLPGRTANGVKNFWNTYLRKRLASCKEDAEERRRKTQTVSITRPRPRSFSKNFSLLDCKTSTTTKGAHLEDKINICKASTTTFDPQLNESWWKNFLAEVEDDQGAHDTSICQSGEEVTANLCSEKSPPGTAAELEDSNFCDFSLDNNLWNFFNS